MKQNIWFHKYRIIKSLGRGGTATVYLAEHIKLNSYRAIKFISKNSPLYNLLLKEAQILKNLKHKCIPTIYDIEEDADGSYIVEQYLEGVTLREYVNSIGRIKESLIIHLTLQICDLFYYLHSKKALLYLDLKPENLIVYNDEIKLIDFGSALYIKELQENHTISGSPGYTAPELFRQSEADARSDIYSIGMLMYFMSTGKIISKEADSMMNIDMVYPYSIRLKKIINRCLKYNPAQRFASIQQLKVSLSEMYKRLQHEINSLSKPLQMAVAGAQNRIGVTHFSFRLCSFLCQERIKCIYQEKNTSRLVRALRIRSGICNSSEGAFTIQGVPILDYEEKEIPDCYRVVVQDYGALNVNTLNDFLAADIKILILGAKEWELEFSERVLDLTADYEDVNYLFNFMDGRQFKQALKSMEHRSCYRIPYEPNPFSKLKENNGLEVFYELTSKVMKDLC